MCTSVSPELSEAGGSGRGNAFPSQILTDQLTLFLQEGGGGDYAQPYYYSSILVPLIFSDLPTALPPPFLFLSYARVATSMLGLGKLVTHRLRT